MKAKQYTSITLSITLA